MMIRHESSSSVSASSASNEEMSTLVSTGISLRLVHAHETADPVSDLLLFLELMVPVGR